jgi:hypothetical protein
MLPSVASSCNSRLETRDHLLGFVKLSPLTDSNRRPPPYHRATRPERRASPGSRGHESRARRWDRSKTSDQAWTLVNVLLFSQRFVAAPWCGFFALGEVVLAETPLFAACSASFLMAVRRVSHRAAVRAKAARA